MALLDTIHKQPKEIIDFDINYSEVLKGRDAVLEGTPTVEVYPEGIDILSSTVNGNYVKVVFGAGVGLEAYKITVLQSTSAGLRYEDEINVMVQEV